MRTAHFLALLTVAFLAVVTTTAESAENANSTSVMEPKTAGDDKNGESTSTAPETTAKNDDKADRADSKSHGSRNDSSTKHDSEEDSHRKQFNTEEDRCSKIIGLYVDGKWKGLEVTYDLHKTLEMHGGAPGKVNATWTEKEDAPVAAEDLDKRPLPDADEEYWIYRYGATDYKSYVRLEHAVHRFSNTPKAFLEISGYIVFTPEDFCGKARKAYYTVDDRGFNFVLTHEYCWVSPTHVTCAMPANCKHQEDGSITCVAAPSTALLAALVGGGK